ncbi:MAG: GerW family sporulation protein [Lachnospiraceae bacterium]|uniref:GerW family sporulation protein n=1 Tax=Roseburia hominis TaxID=301301 RepID=UPI001F47E2CE|nr:GerW family sporulation protein [Roseburia hominis]MDD6169472.1 GerW family sporulation protein [Lachnospiraceae bacterium]MDY4839613.1 GerW family sporulation protein [Lachnospiraceae bacterium]
MSETNNTFRQTVESLFKGMDNFITTKTVVGDAIHIGETIILPLVDVSFGVAAGAMTQDKKNNGAGGMGGKITPSAVLVIQNGTTKLVNIKNQDGITKVLDMVPDFVNKFADKKSSKENDKNDVDEETKKKASDEMEEILSDAVSKTEETNE